MPSFFEPIYDLTLRAMKGFAGGQLPQAVFLKAVFQFARDEGYPVKEQWLRELPAEYQEGVIAVLRTPLQEICQPPESIERMRQDLMEYLRQKTDFWL
ncbi:MAG: hypothetical protein LR015_03055 [Verrucomicrobia bacterium]|nr:hypothetical protein [Verrucomicrobiota bacterium]